MSKRQVLRYVRKSLRSMVVPGIGVFVKRVTVNNGNFGVRRCLFAQVWDPKEGRSQGLTVWCWDDNEFLWEVLQELYNMGLKRKGQTWIRTAR